MRLVAYVAVLVLWVPLGCSGRIADPRPSGSAAGADGIDALGRCVAGVPEPTLRRLTRPEYAASVRALVPLGDHDPTAGFPPDEDPGGLGFPVAATLSPLQVELYASAAANAARLAVTHIEELVACDPVIAGEQACAEVFVDDFASRAYRRPLDVAQRRRLLDLYAQVRTDGGSFADGIRVLVEATLQSPLFLYRVELDARGEPGSVVELSGYERATRLSYALFGGPPDEALRAAAASGALATADGVEAEARRMLGDPRARAHMRDFVIEWLAIRNAEPAKNETAFPDFEATWPSLRLETDRFVEHVLFDGTGTLEELLTAPYTFADAAVGRIYGVDVEGDAFTRLDLDPTQRAGVLTHPALLSVHAHEVETSPVLRGRFVRERLLCQTMPPPPPDAEDGFPAVDPSLPVRDRFAQHEADPTCAGCHVLMDPLGFAFEHYDAVGRYRATDEGRAIDASGEIVGTDSTDTTFDGAVELAHVLAASEDVQWCSATQAYRYMLGDADVGGCALDEIERAFDASGLDLQELFVAIARSDAFLHRRVDEGEAP